MAVGPVTRARITFRFYAELNDFLPPPRRQVAFEHVLEGPASVKDTIEALGVPHTELDLILANGESVDFSYRLADGDRIAAYPVFESLDITPLLRVRPEPLRRPRFVLDTHLGRLASYLRLLGFDALYDNGADDETLAGLAANADGSVGYGLQRYDSQGHGPQGSDLQDYAPRVSDLPDHELQSRRILLTRDRGLLKRGQVTHGYCLRSTDSHEQLREVVQRFDLAGSARPFTRCLACNGELRPASREEVSHLLPEHTRRLYHEFGRCAACGRVYWKGGHYERLRGLVEEVLGSGRA